MGLESYSVRTSYTRGRLLQANDTVALGVDVANTANAGNTNEKLLAHQIAVAHKVALEQTAAAEHSLDPANEVKRLQVAARRVQVSQQAALQNSKRSAIIPSSFSMSPSAVMSRR